MVIVELVKRLGLFGAMRMYVPLSLELGGEAS